jgi:hypothetical protein
LDVTVGKVEVSGRPPRRFALAPKGSDHPLTAVRAAFVGQGWHAGRAPTVISDGEADRRRSEHDLIVAHEQVGLRGACRAVHHDTKPVAHWRNTPFEIR